MALKIEDVKFTRKSNGVYYVALRGRHPRWISTGKTTEEQAFKAALRLEAKLYGRVETIPTLARFCFDGSTSIFDVAGSYRRSREARGFKISDAHYIRMKSHLINHILPRFGQYKLNDIKAREVDEWLISLERVGEAKQLSNETKNKVLIFFKQVMDYAVTKDYIEQNPMGAVKFFQKNSEPKKPFTEEQLRLLFPDDIKVLSDIWQGAMWASYFCVLRDSGARPGEIAALTWYDWLYSDGDEIEGFYVNKTANAATGAIKLSPKTQAGFRAIPIFNDNTKSILRVWRRESPFMKDDDLIFGFGPSLNGSPKGLISNTINKHLKLSAKRAGCNISYVDGKGVERYQTAHCFRWTFNTMARKKLTNEQLQRLIGHTSTVMTNHYDNPDKNELRARLAVAITCLKS